MSQTKNKTTQNDGDVSAFLERVELEKRKADSFKALAPFKKITKTESRMWGMSIVGFGTYHYKYESSREGDACISGFSPRKMH